MNDHQMNCIALGYIAHCMQAELANADCHPETICDHLEDALQGLAGLFQWLPLSPYAWLCNRLDDSAMRAILQAAHAILGWHDAIIYEDSENA